MSGNLYGVLIGDILSSSATPHLRGVLAERLRALSRAHLSRKLIRLPYAVTAGDEFQTIITNVAQIPRLIFDLRVGHRPLTLWIGIGIGQITGPLRPPVNRISGQAFEFAREAIESIKRRKEHEFLALTAFRTMSKDFNTIARSVYGLHDTLVQQVSDKQWKTIQAMLQKRSVHLAARALSRARSTASRSLQRGYYWQIIETVSNMEALIRAYFG